MFKRAEYAPASEADGNVPGRQVALVVNGHRRLVGIEDRQLLVEVLRETLGLTGTHIGCHGGDCGACTVRLDGRIAKACLVLAASVDGSEVTTIEAMRRTANSTSCSGHLGI